MDKSRAFLCSTIARKQIIGLTGIALSLFVLGHMVGNILMFVSPEAYNLYGHTLVSNPLIYFIEAGLMTVFVLHFGLAINISIENRRARKTSYAKAAVGDKGTSLIEKTMIHQGMILLVFIVWHIQTFKLGPNYDYTVISTGEIIRDLYRLLIEIFSQPLYVAGYLIGLTVLGLHLSHGLSSSIRTLGFNHPKYDKKIRAIGIIYATLVLFGFAAQPLYIYMIN